MVAGIEYLHPELLVQRYGGHRIRTRKPLGARVCEVAYLIASGLTNQEIVAHMKISIRTVENYIYMVREYYGINGLTSSNRVLLAYAIIGEHNDDRLDLDAWISPDTTELGLTLVRHSSKQPVPLVPIAPNPLIVPLTPRMAKTAQLLADGYTNAEIADAMTVNIATITNHLRIVYRHYNIAGAEYSSKRVKLAYAIIGGEQVRL
jgi:DNA-binding CsgD family transcriptional regulator